MTDCPNFKFGQNFYDRTRFFPGRTNPGNRVGRIFASPTYWRLWCGQVMPSTPICGMLIPYTFLDNVRVYI